MSRLFAALAVAVFTPALAPAAPRDEVLRAAPPDAAILILVQNARDQANAVANSPFAAWFPTSTLGRQLLTGVDVKQFRDSTAAIVAALGATPEELLAEVFGDAAALAFTPAPPNDAAGERAVLFVRPRKPELLEKLIGRLNSLQTENGEVKAVVRRKHGAADYFERQKAVGSDFYGFAGSVFVFSSTEAEVTAALDRERAAIKSTLLASRLDRLGVADAALVLLVNPRALDAEVKSKIAQAKPDERPFLAKFEEVWAGLDAAAVYVALGTGVEAGIALDFRPDALPAAAKAWLTGPRTPSPLWKAIPAEALFAFTPRFRAGELIDTIRTLLPPDGSKALDTALADSLGPVFGRNKLAAVLAALGPDWAVWAEPPPTAGGFLPVAVAAVRIAPVGADANETRRAIERAVGFGFQAARVAYNASHADQIDLIETPDGDGIVTTFVNDKGFPPGFRPSYAFKGGYLVVASSPAAVVRFRAPAGDAVPHGEAVAARISAAGVRSYLNAHREPLAAFLAKSGFAADVGPQIDQLAAVLEPVETIEVVTRGTATGLRLALRVTLVKPLK